MVAWIPVFAGMTLEDVHASSRVPGPGGGDPGRRRSEIIDKLDAKMVEIAKTPEMKARLLAMNVAFTPQTPDEMGRHLVEDTRRVAELIKLTNLKIE